ncbi:MAG: magnesium chelatase ATPase subunit I [Pyrinomonadaceae bacterium]
MSKTRKTVAAASSDPSVYPFSAIVAQEEMKLALVLNAIDPSIGGVLIMGHRGTGKSTVVRAVADLLPARAVIAGCAYSCEPADSKNICAECRIKTKTKKPLRKAKSAVPVVELPLGATEDRVVGTIDIEQALRSGVKRFAPGLLARANRGFLYIDEVNLLEDHLVDLLLDVAATGVNKVERESVSVEHPARFVLIGSGNPEEGELRPQLLDRFGLYVEVKTENSLNHRIEIIERREAFESDPEGFRRKFGVAQERLRKNITGARKNSAQVKLQRSVLRDIAQLCSELKIDGHRGELTISRAARALAAFEGRQKITSDDVKRVAVMCLRHRLPREPMDETSGLSRIEEALDRVFATDDSEFRDDDPEGGSSSNETRREKRMHAGASDGAHSFSGAEGNGDAGRDGTAEAHNGLRSLATPSFEARISKLSLRNDLKLHHRPGNQLRQSGRPAGATRTIYHNERGRYVRAVDSSRGGKAVALDATIRAALRSTTELTGRAGDVRQSRRRRTLAPVAGEVVRYKLFKRKPGRLFIFAVDLSGSMAMNRIEMARTFMVALLRRSYIERDSVAIIGFRGRSAELLLPPSKSILRARRVLDSMSVGGGTPVAAGLHYSLQLIKRVGRKSGEIALLLFTDGQANVAFASNQVADRNARRQAVNNEIAHLGSQLRKASVNVTVVDTQSGFRSTGKAQILADTLGTECRRLHELFKPSPGQIPAASIRRRQG